LYRAAAALHSDKLFFCDDQAQTFTIPVQNATWYLDIAPANGPFQNSKILLDGLMYCFIRILLSLLLTFVIILNTKNKIIQRQNRTDTLINLPNRNWFYTLLHTALTKHFSTAYNEGDPKLHLCVLDLNDFKKINDTYSHIVGDKLLIEFSRRISQSLQPNEFASRLGGDEFLTVFYCVPAQDNSLPPRLTEIQNYLQQPYIINGVTYDITTSLGYICPEKESLSEKDPKLSEEEFFLDKADQIMYEHKRKYHETHPKSR
jgi:diguanylate cyclase (GGDEF)-like protein